MSSLPITYFRPSAAHMSANSIQEFCQTVVDLKNKFRPGGIVSIFDEFVVIHWAVTKLSTDGGHRGSAFLPWHREFLYRYELELKAINNSVSLPYWDWSGWRHSASHQWDPNRVFNAMFTPNFIGPSGSGSGSVGPITSGFFSGWTVPSILVGVDFNFPASWGSQLQRNTSLNPATWSSWKTAVENNVMTQSAYSTFRSNLESHPHGTGHIWTGGHMSAMGSPSDPLFYLHHAEVDRLWYHWERDHVQNNDWVAIFQDQNRDGHRLNDNMWPWDGGDRGFPAVPAGRTDLEDLINNIVANFNYLKKPIDLLDPFVYKYTYETDEEAMAALLTVGISGCCSRCQGMPS